jgi:hypothetical protein
MKVKVNELTGPALDWTVAKCAGRQTYIQNGEVWFTDSETHPDGSETDYSSWLLCGPIIEQEKIEICHWFSDNSWHAANNTKLSYDDSGEFITGSDFLSQGPTPLIAAMRCYCASKLGDEVEIPEELE